MALILGLAGIAYTGLFSWQIIQRELIEEASIRLKLAASDLILQIRELQFEYQMTKLISPTRKTELYLLQRKKLLNSVTKKAQEAGLFYLIEDKNKKIISGTIKNLEIFRSRIVREKIIETPEFSFIIHLGIPKRNLEKALRQGLFYYIFSVLIGTFVLFILGYKVYHLWIQKPLSQVIYALENDQELRPCGIREIDLLVKSIQEALRREKELVKKLAFTEKMSALGVLAGGYAHEFNNLLQIISGSLDLSEGLIQKGETEKAIKLLERAKNAALKGKKISNRILGLARHKTSSGGTFLCETVSHILESVKSGLPNHIKLVWEKNKKDFYTPLSEEEWQEILLNLILNARDAIVSKGVEEGKIIVRLVEEGKLVGIEVEDNGCGIPEEARTRIFEPFFTTKEPGKGTGLGLYLIHRLVTESGGRIEVESNSGGTRIKILVPLSEAPPKKKVTQTPKLKTVPTQDKVRILVIDDEKDLRNNLVEILHLWNYESEGAGSVEEALEKIAKNNYQALLVDLFMPGKNGLYLIKSLPKNFSGTIVLITGYAGNLEKEVKDLLEQGRIHYVLRKPFSSEELKKILQEVIK